MRNYMEEYQRWLDSPALSNAEWEELNAIRDDKKEIESRFFAPLEFGTAGLRGEMALGCRRMNIHVIRHATQAFAEVIKAEGEEACKKGVVVCNIGDASLGCGPVYEAMNFSAMDQFKTLWEEGRKGGLPIIFNVFDNFYGMGGQTMGETMAYNMPARLGAGITPSQMHAERVDGWNPLAVIDAYKRKMELIKLSLIHI